VDTTVEGLTNIQAKASVAVVATTNLDLTGEETIDGVLTSASRVLVAGQSSAAENGVYTTGAGAWTRTTDADAWAEIENAAVVVTGGTTYGGSRWQAQVAAGGTIGSTAMTWYQIASAATFTASDGITKDGSNFELSPMATMTIKGNDTGGSAIPQDLTATEVTAMLNGFGAAKGLVPAVTATGAQYLGDGGWDDTLTPVSVTASGNVTGANLSGTNTGDQTITLTGDVTGTGTGSFSSTIANNAVTLAKMADIATARIIGRTTALTGDPEALTMAQVKTMLDLTGTNSGDQTTVSGNAGSATVLATGRTIAISGGATGTATSFNGSANITIPITALDLSYASGILPVAAGGTGVGTSTGTGNAVLSDSPTFTGVVGFANGTAAAPSVMFSGDTDTGIYRYGANSIGFAAGGTAVARIGADGYLNLAGITASDVVQAGAGSAALPSFVMGSDTNTGFYNIGADQLGISTGGTLRVTVSTTAVTSTLPLRVNDGSAAAPSHSFSGYTDSGLYTNAGAVHVATGGVSRCSFSASGVAASVDMSTTGLLTCGTLRINTAPTVAAAVASTHKVSVNINGTTYYLLATT
jgi:hypothetical protein